MNMELNEISSNLRKEHWKSLIKEREESGLSIVNWCNERNINPSTYHYWLKRIRQEQCDKALAKGIINPNGDIVELPIHQKNTYETPNEATAIRFTMGQTTISITNDISPELLSMMLELIK